MLELFRGRSCLRDMKWLFLTQMVSQTFSDTLSQPAQLSILAINWRTAQVQQQFADLSNASNSASLSSLQLLLEV